MKDLRTSANGSISCSVGVSRGETEGQKQISDNMMMWERTSRVPHFQLDYGKH